MPTNALQQLKQWTTVVVDSGDIDSIDKHQPLDATTNPSLLLKSIGHPKLQQAMKTEKAHARQASQIAERLAVRAGCHILDKIEGRISTEVDARLSFDTAATIQKARTLTALYRAEGISRDRFLIKIAATWEGIEAARVLEQEGIHCNLTLIFDTAQAIAAAQAGAFLISPFVGRIHDWYLQHGSLPEDPGQDPGVVSVRNIYQHFKRFGYDTVVMGASFRNTSQILALSGCDRLTISPTLMDELASMNQPLERQLAPASHSGEKDPLLSEADFRWQLNNNPMATEKLAEGIRLFARDQEKLEALINDA